MKSLACLLLIALLSPWAAAQDLEFHPPAAADAPATAGIMRDLAERTLPVYQEDDPERYLINLSALQLVAGDYDTAYQSRQSLRERRRKADAGRPVGREVIYDIYAHARAIEAQSHIPFAQAFTQSFRDVVPHLNDADAYVVTGWLATRLAARQAALQRVFDQHRAKGTVSVAEAVEMIRTYLAFDAYRSFGPLIDSLNSEDDHARYSFEDNVLIKSPDGSTVAAVLVRPKSATKPLPALLELTIHVDAQNDAKECAAHGYVGVVAFTRGIATNGFPIVPYEHDAADARQVIDWITAQPWSDGRVAMYGSSYSAFTQWAAAKHLPSALKAIATSAATAPGIDFPMEGNIYRSSAYRWGSCVVNAKGFDQKTCTDDAAWRALDETWYKSGKAYQELDRLNGKPSRFFHRWLNHPSYDLFWQKMIPYKEEFAAINIPVLATSGYYAASQIGTLYYFTQHYRYNPKADQTLLIGPYDDAAMQRGVLANLQDYAVDPVAVMDLRELRYQWFDYILKGAAQPALLKERVNYEVMGANEWRHAASIEAMAKAPLRFYLDARSLLENHRPARKGAAPTFLRQSVSLTDRSDAAWVPPADIIAKDLQARNAVTFVSAPLRRALEFSGLFSGRLDFTVNKMDMDLAIALYEVLPSGEYLKLFDPAYEFRASYARDRVHRHLLKAGEREQLAFKSERFTSRKLAAGSRVVLVLGINKRPDHEINYGTGNNVSEDSIEDGKVPLRIRWYSTSYIDLPVRR